MKKQTITINTNPIDLVKETPEQRRARINAGGMYTRVARPKKGKGSYNRQAFKRGD